jgi:hypothetical protein
MPSIKLHDEENTMQLDPPQPALDVSQLQAEAQAIVKAAAEVYIRHTRPWFVGLLAHGSALKGGFIPGCSDIDLQLYLDDAAFIAPGLLPLDLGKAIQRELAQIDPAPFQYIQCYPHGPHPPEGYVGPIPGAYQLIAGHLPVAEATDTQLRASARHALARLETRPSFVLRMLLQHGGGKIARQARLLCTVLWPTLYQVVALQQASAVEVWRQPKEQVISLLPAQSELSRTIRWFHRAVCAYYPEQNSVEGALELFESGFAFLKAAKSWWQNEAVPATDER